MSKSWQGGAWRASEVKSYDAGLSGAQRCKQLRLGGRRAEPVEICAPDPAVLYAVHSVLCNSWCVLCILGCVHCNLLCALLRGLCAIQCAERRCANQTELLDKGASSCCTLTPPASVLHVWQSCNLATVQCSLWWITDRLV